MIKDPRHLSSKPHALPHRRTHQFLHVDGLLFLYLLLISLTGLFILYSASNQNLFVVQNQAIRLAFAFGMMLIVAQISPVTMQRSAPIFFGGCLLLLIIVLIMGHIGKGAQRWLTVGFVRFQPAELMKIAIPLCLGWYFHKVTLPMHAKHAFIALPIILVPAILTAKQPDLSTAILMILSGSAVLFLAGLSIRIILGFSCAVLASIPFVWYLLHDYQRQRVLNFLNPDRDPLGTGYHIIQSKIAIGSGGVFGKGWLNGTQSNLHFLPERSTDFIFAVCGEELGMIGSLLLILLYLLIVIRGLHITMLAQDTFSRLVAGSITFTFFFSFFINMGMVTGILPVVGIPLPLVSYGGSSMMTVMITFGILMSIQTHRRLVTT